MSGKIKCEVCGTEHFVSPDLKMCGPCVTGCADDFDIFDRVEIQVVSQKENENEASGNISSGDAGSPDNSDDRGPEAE